MEKKAKPFFAKFLENQLKQAETEQLKGGNKSAGYITNAYPSDQEEAFPLPTNVLRDNLAITDKYPSDSDDDIVFTDF